MSFRLWHYTCKVLAPLLMGVCVISLIWRDSFGSWVGAVAVLSLFAIGMVGAVMGLRMTAGKLHMKCPFCGASGPVWGGRQEGMRMRCPDCGIIRSSGLFGLKPVHEKATEMPAAARTTKTLEEFLPDQRPLRPLFPDGLVYFRQWKYVRWYLVMLVPLIISAYAAWRRAQPVAGVATIFFGGSVACIIFISICSGRISSNRGTYLRSHEPHQFWSAIAVLAAVYLGLCLLGWAVK